MTTTIISRRDAYKVLNINTKYTIQAAGLYCILLLNTCPNLSINLQIAAEKLICLSKVN